MNATLKSWIMAAAAVLSTIIVACAFRFDLTPAAEGYAVYRVDRWTGAVTMIRNGEADPVEFGNWWAKDELVTDAGQHDDVKPPTTGSFWNRTDVKKAGGAGAVGAAIALIYGAYVLIAYMIRRLRRRRAARSL